MIHPSTIEVWVFRIWIPPRGHPHYLRSKLIRNNVWFFLKVNYGSPWFLSISWGYSYQSWTDCSFWKVHRRCYLWYFTKSTNIVDRISKYSTREKNHYRDKLSFWCVNWNHITISYGSHRYYAPVERIKLSWTFKFTYNSSQGAWSNLNFLIQQLD